jgi:hypothetical protein
MMGRPLEDLYNDRAVFLKELKPGERKVYQLDERPTPLSETVKIWQRSGVIECYKPAPTYGPIVLAGLLGFVSGYFLGFSSAGAIRHRVETLAVEAVPRLEGAAETSSPPSAQSKDRDRR